MEGDGKTKQYALILSSYVFLCIFPPHQPLLINTFHLTIKPNMKMNSARSQINLFYDSISELSIPIKMSTFFGNSEHPFPEK